VFDLAQLERFEWNTRALPAEVEVRQQKLIQTIIRGVGFQ